jgi:hypothetical protein
MSASFVRIFIIMHKSTAKIQRNTRNYAQTSYSTCIILRGQITGGENMGPFPHHSVVSEISEANPAGTNGMEFVEFAHPNPQ